MLLWNSLLRNTNSKEKKSYFLEEQGREEIFKVSLHKVND